jgi:hypothetical protein
VSCWDIGGNVHTSIGKDGSILDEGVDAGSAWVDSGYQRTMMHDGCDEMTSVCG